MPKNKDELKLVAGFGEIKVNKYGDDILKIVNKHR
jgi:superfamily II DNA helicase RecQ